MSKSVEIGRCEFQASLRLARDHITAGRPRLAESMLRQVVTKNPCSAEAWNELGRALNNLRHFEDAIESLREAIRLDPQFAVAWNHLGHVLRAHGQAIDAREAFEHAVEIEPGLTAARRNLAIMLLAEGEFDAGIAQIEEGLRHRPDDPQLHTLIAEAFNMRGNLEQAETHYRVALDLCPDCAIAASGLGVILQSKHKYAAARESYSKALAAVPGDTTAAVGLATIFSLEGRLEEGLALLEGRLAEPPVSARLAATAARLLRGLGRREEAWAALQAAETTGTHDADAALLAFARADLLHDAGNTAAAFAEYRRANSQLPDSFDRASFRRTVDRLIRFFTPERVKILEKSSSSSARPVFIVGMPRSGTTLVEQMLAAHSEVRAGGERTALFEYVRELARRDAEQYWPEILCRTSSAHLDELATHYLTEVSGGRRVTDKMPANFLNLGLINLLFPSARVVYCRRNPMDVGLSCYRTHFQSRGMAFTCRLENIALYQQGCQRLMAHWAKVLDIRIHTIDYESLVSEFKASTRALLRFLDLPWETACLHPEQVQRLVPTASHEQVRRPVYQSSVGGWHRYRRELEPLRTALDSPWDGGAAD